MKIAIAGAGAMGSRFGLMLHESGNEVILIDQWPDHIKAIRENGLIANFNGETIVAQIPIYAPEEVASLDQEVDLIIALTKANQLDAMFNSIKSLINETTHVICLLNGLGHEDVISKYVAKEQILLGITMWTAGLEGPGKAKLFGTGEVELENIEPAGADFAKKVTDIFTEAGLNAVYSDNVKHSVWRKACVNGTLNGLCTILDCNITDLGTQPVSENMIRTIIHEFATVALKENITLDEEEVYQHVATTFDPNGVGLHHPSMHQDLIKNNRLTEIDYINGAVSRKGQALQIATPYCDFLTSLVHAKEGILKAK